MAETVIRALSVRAPWWWFILHGGKDVENRPRRHPFRGTVLLHASTWWQTIEALDHMRSFSPLAERAGAPRVTMEMVRPHGGRIVGRVDIVDCVTGLDSPWFFGPYGFVLANPVAFAEPIPCRGALGFFPVPDAVARAAAGAA